MKKLFNTLLVTLFLSVLLIQQAALASGKMQVAIGERVDFEAEIRRVGTQYRWVATFDGEILATQTGPNFSHVFNRQGEYIVSLTATLDSQNVDTTTIRVLAGDLYRQSSTPVADGQPLPVGRVPLRIHLETLPHQTEDGRVEALGDGSVRYDLSLSTGEIIEYRIDENVFVDSDGNGTANDDIDNANHPSYLTGEPYLATYEVDESARVAAEITLVDREGQRVRQQVEVVFREPDESGDPVAVLDVAPAPGDENIVRLYNDPHTVAFYSRRSTGNIVEYRIDRNIFEDSDQDGDPANDIDNFDHPSFRTGDVWETDYAKTDQQIIAQLIAVGSGGRGSRVQRSLVFGDKPAVIVPISDVVEPGVIRLTADKDLVKIGDPIRFEVVGLQQNLSQYLFEWDFDGDEAFDKEVEGVNTVEHIYSDPGVFETVARVTDAEGNSAEKTLQVTVRDRLETEANFEFTVEGNTVIFNNLSTAADALSDQRLRTMWSFGDTEEANFEAQKDQIGAENPTYTYAKAGSYIITLTVTDANDVLSTRTETIDIAQDFVPAEGAPEDSDGIESGADGSIFIRLLKIVLYLVLIVIALVLFVAGGLLGFTKVQHPDLTFEELVDELKAKFLARMGVHEDMPAPPADLPKTPMAEPVPAKPEPAVTETPAAPVSAPKGPVPDWLKDKPSGVDTLAGRQVIEGEVEEESTPAPEAPPAPKKPEAPTPEQPDASGEPPAPEGPTPDWLKKS